MSDRHMTRRDHALDRAERGVPVNDPRQRALDQCVRAAGEQLAESPDELRMLMLTVLRSNQKLWEVAERNPPSLVAAFTQMSRLGLDVDPAMQHCHFIPRGSEVSLMLGYRGLMELARRSPDIKRIRARAVREGDDFRVLMGTEERIAHIPQLDGEQDPNSYTHVYAIVDHADGSSDFEVMSHAECEHVRKEAKGGPPWRKWPVEMAKKTVIRRLCKRLPLTRDAAHGMAAEDAEAVSTPPPPATKPDDVPGEFVTTQQVGMDSAPPMDVAPEEGVVLWGLPALGAIRVARALKCATNPADMRAAATKAGVDQTDVGNVAAVPDDGADATFALVVTHADALAFFPDVDLAAVADFAGCTVPTVEGISAFAEQQGVTPAQVLDACWTVLCRS